MPRKEAPDPGNSHKNQSSSKIVLRANLMKLPAEASPYERPCRVCSREDCVCFTCNSSTAASIAFALHTSRFQCMHLSPGDFESHSPQGMAKVPKNIAYLLHVGHTSRSQFGSEHYCRHFVYDFECGQKPHSDG